MMMMMMMHAMVVVALITIVLERTGGGDNGLLLWLWICGRRGGGLDGGRAFPPISRQSGMYVGIGPGTKIRDGSVTEP